MPPRTRSLLLGLAALAILLAVALSGSARRDTDPKTPADRPALRDATPRYWKGNLHTHSFWSDGDDFPEMIADWYKTKGYDFLSLTDHNILADGEKWIDITEKSTRAVALKKYRDRFGAAWVETRRAKVKVKEKDKQERIEEREQVRLKPLAEFRSHLEEPGKFLLIQGEEVTHKYAKLPVHMNAINLRDVIKPIDGPSVAETIQVNHRLIAEAAKKTGWKILPFLNHPNFGWGVRAEDMLVPELRFFEVFNGHPGVKNYGDDLHASTERVWDIILTLRLAKLDLPIVYGVATDDAHGYHAFGIGKVNPGRGWVMVKAPFLTAEHIVGAMNKGDYYFSTGVKLKEVHREKESLSLEIDAEPGVSYKTQFIATFRDAPLEAKPKVGKDGKELTVTQEYSAEIGKVVSESDGHAPTYRLTGRELYVRARVISSKPHPNPYAKGDVEVAWTQPVTP